MPRVLIAQSAWQVIVTEIRYFADLGNKEAIVYPMFGFWRSWRCLKPPWEVLGLSDIEYFAVTDAYAPDRAYADHGAVRAGWAFANPEEEAAWQQKLAAWSNAINERSLQLEVGNVHSHPFASVWTQPSNFGPQSDYARIYRLWEEMLQWKVNTPLEIILCRDRGSPNGWRACCFGFNRRQQIVSFGSAQIVADADHRIKRLTALHWSKSQPGADWLSRQKEQLGHSGQVKVAELYFGWYSIQVQLEKNRFAFIHVPPDFPNCRSLLCHQCTAHNGLSVGRRIRVFQRSFELDLRTIIARIRKEWWQW